jgi:predicted MPP superfamily phosphohydrolase
LPTPKALMKFFLIIIAFPLLNIVTLTAAGALYPAYFHWFLLACFFGNILWIFVPKIFRRKTTTRLRWARAYLGPPWFMWTLFMVLFSLFLVLDCLAWGLRCSLGFVPFTAFTHPLANGYLIFLAIIWIIGMVQALVGWHVARVTVGIPRLPRAFRGFKIAMLSDLHVGLFTRPSRLRQFIKIALRNNPDLIVIAGDITDDNAYYIPKFLRCLKQVKSKVPLVAILGNHDLYGGGHETIAELKGSALRILVNQGFALRRGKSALWIAGLSDYAANRHKRFSDLSPDLAKSLKGRPPNSPTVLLAHQPHAFEEAVRHKVELTLSGHTHGGQLGIRFLDWSLAKAFTPWHMGHYEKQGCQLYVTVGTGFWMIPFRFGLPPEISLLELI